MQGSVVETSPPKTNERVEADMIYISDANDPATVKADVDIFFSPSTGYFQDTDADEVAAITADFTSAFNTKTLPSYWAHGYKTAALI